jgi:hypothetical protein
MVAGAPFSRVSAAFCCIHFAICASAILFINKPVINKPCCMAGMFEAFAQWRAHCRNDERKHLLRTYQTEARRQAAGLCQLQTVVVLFMLLRCAAFLI